MKILPNSPDTLLKPLLVSSGEPAGIGPDLCLKLAFNQLDRPIVILGDKAILAERAKLLGLSVRLIDFEPPFKLSSENLKLEPSELLVWSLPVARPVKAGQLDCENAAYVLALLERGLQACLQGEFAGLVTAPVHKGIINEAGISFTGHTEWLAQETGSKEVIMMLACEAMKVALLTTHLPLRAVPDALSVERIVEKITALDYCLKKDFALKTPVLYLAGLNPHAGEGGYLGREEIEIISPALARLKQKGIRIEGPFPADTLFTPKHLKACDVFVGVYHDQVLPVLKYAGFGQAVNITLGLPIIRTSVDHGTALDLAGTGEAELGSLVTAVNMAAHLASLK